MSILGRGLRRRFSPQQYEQRSQGEQIRDLSDAAAAGVAWSTRTLDASYIEPLWIGNLAAKPIAIIAGTIVNLQAQDEPVFGGGTVHFVWDGTGTGARITSIDGLTPIAGAQYRFTFLIAEGRAA